MQKLADIVEAPGDALATFFDAKVELPPSVRSILGSQGSEALVLIMFFCKHQKPVSSSFCRLNIYMKYECFPFKSSLHFSFVLGPTLPR